MIIAHRGASNLAPENTCASIKKALEVGCDGIEIDIHLTKDDKIVVHHDHSTERISGTKLDIKESTLAELKELDVGSSKSDKYKNERIPELKEILALLPEKTLLFIEIKSSKKIVSFLQEELNAFPALKDQIIIIAFDKEVALASKKLLPDIPFYFLFFSKPADFNSNKLEEIIHFCQTNHLEGLDINWQIITQEVASTIKQNNLGLYCWTVNHKADAENLLAMKVDGITTDKPEMFV